MAKTKKELFTLNADLHTEADLMLKESGLGKLIKEAGYKPVGSYAMQTMTWRDLDFERIEDPPDWQRHLQFGEKLMRLGWLWEVDSMNTFITDYFPGLPKGYFWGIRGEYPKGGPTWKFDLWAARQEEFERERDNSRMTNWMRKLTEEKRFYILAIKDAICHTLEYRRTIHSVDIYEAVLDCNISNLEDFREWCKVKHANDKFI
jgi:hypothetical protein